MASLTSAEIDRYLPGRPSKRLVKSVRKHLRLYQITPRNHDLWPQAWAWANKTRLSYYAPHWPLASEIATQYLVLLLALMRNDGSIRMPHRARECMTESVRHRLGHDNAQLRLEGE